MKASEFSSPTNCLLLPIPELGEAADALDEAANMILAGRHDRARELIDKADIRALYPFAEDNTRGSKPFDYRERKVPNAPDKLKPKDRVPLVPPTSPLGKRTFGRDGWRCRFCECRVIPAEVRGKINNLLPNAIRWGNDPTECHTGFRALWGTIDHVLPRSRGGGNDPSNLVVACFVCQFGRMERTLEEHGLIDPRERDPIVDQWDGLTRLLT